MLSLGLGVGLKVVSWLLGRSQASAEAKQRFLDFLEAMAPSLDSSARLAQSYRAQLEALRKEPKP